MASRAERSASRDLDSEHASMRRVLMVAYHFPPYSGSSGLWRTLSFCRYLPHHGWHPLVLTTRPSAYPETSDYADDDLPPSVQVERVRALDAARHLAIGGRYVSWSAVPDRWVSWFVGGVARGLRLIRTRAPRVIWSTYPIATAHLIGLALHRLTGLPWVADFRDPMTEIDVETNRRFPS